MVTAVGIIADSKQQGPPFSPEQLTGLRVWLDAQDAATITQVANAVSQWNDKSGNNFNVVQATGANQPLTNTTNINGKNTFSFNGTTQYLSAPPCQLVNPSTGEWTAFGVGKSNAIAAFHSIVDQDSGVAPTRIAVFFRTQGTGFHSVTFDSAATQFQEQATGWNAGTSLYFSSVRTTTSIELWRHGVSNGATATTGTPITGSYNLGIGANRTGGTALLFWSGEIGEVLVYNVALSTTDRVKVENYLKAKWGF